MNQLFGVMGEFSIVHWIIVVMILALNVFWLWMLIEALVKEPTTAEKLLWFLVIFLLHFIGALIYFFVRRSRR